MNTTKLYKTTDLVKEILMKNKQARNSDTHLYLQVIYKVGMLKGIDVNAMPVTEFLMKRNKLGFPCYESVSRARRKLQAEYPELAGSECVEETREIYEGYYKEYARRKLSE